MGEDIYKIRYFRLISRISQEITWMQNDRCPFARNCCGACEKLKKVIADTKMEYRRDKSGEADIRDT